jgi:ribokinase
MGRVVVLGSLNLDLVVAVPRHPAPGETVLGGPLRRAFGGKGANQAVAAAAAGAVTALVGRVGDDDAGRAYLARLRGLGVDAGRVTADPGAATGHAIVVVDAGGENSIVVSPGANAGVGDADAAAAAGELGPGDVLALQLEVAVDVVAAAARAAAARGARVVLNLAPYADVPADVLALADPVVVNEHEHGLLRGSAAHDRRRGPPSLLVTSGAAGSRWGDLRVAAVPVTDVVDTTGAGDAYCGTLAARLALGDEPATAMAAASAAAAESVTRVGAQP